MDAVTSTPKKMRYSRGHEWTEDYSLDGHPKHSVKVSINNGPSVTRCLRCMIEWMASNPSLGTVHEVIATGS